MKPTLSLTALLEEILSHFRKQEKGISEKSGQEGLQYAFEGYVQDVKLTQQQKAYRSQCKIEQPPHLAVETDDVKQGRSLFTVKITIKSMCIQYT